MLNKKMNSKFILKYHKKIKIVLPCLLGVIQAFTIPSEPIEYMKINDVDNIISVNNEHKINFSTNLDKIDYKDFIYTVSDESVEKLSYYGEKMGMNRSALCAYFVGQGLLSMDKAYSLIDRFASDMSEEMKKTLAEPSDKTSDSGAK